MIEVGDIVLYSFAGEAEPRRWRVNGHMKRVEINFATRSKDRLTAISARIAKRQYRHERRQRRKQGLPSFRKFRLVWCKPSEATHLELTGVCGAIATIEKCTKIGVVAWDEEHIQEARTSALKLVELNYVTAPIFDWE